MFVLLLLFFFGRTDLSCHIGKRLFSVFCVFWSFPFLNTGRQLAVRIFYINWAKSLKDKSHGHLRRRETKPSPTIYDIDYIDNLAVEYLTLWVIEHSLPSTLPSSDKASDVRQRLYPNTWNRSVRLHRLNPSESVWCSVWEFSQKAGQNQFMMLCKQQQM